MQYVCRIGMPDGRVVEQVRNAQDEAALRRELERQGLHVFEARPKGLPRRLPLPSLRRSGRKIKDSEFMIFNKELASLLKAGLPLLQTLDMMLERMPQGRFREVLTDVHRRVRSGEEMSEAFAVHREHFPRLYPPTLKAGERSGDLESVLRRFVRYLKLVGDARKRVVSALMYPAVLVCLSLTMVFILSVAVIPNFQEFFETLNVELPLITKITLGGSLFLVNNLLLITVGLVVGFWLFRRWVNTDAGRLMVDRWKLKIPILGGVLHRFALSEFCRSLATLISGGIPLVSSFETSVDAVGNAYVRSRLQPTIRSIREGGAFYEALEDSEIFPPLAIDMVKVGEATGALDEMLTNISDFFDEEVETRLQRTLALIEPLMLVFLGIVIALLLASIYLPLFSSMSQTGF